MKAKVLNEFKDKYSGKIHKKGATIHISKARFDEINKVAEAKKIKPLVEEIKETKKADKTAE